MKSGKIFIALCVLFALASAAFIGLTVMNLTKEKNPQAKVQKAASATVMNMDVVYDVPGASLEKIISNDEKRTEYPEGILEYLKPAYAVNHDLAGILTIPGTELCTAVTIGSDNSFYLKRDFYGRYTSDMTSTNYGSPFLDYRCSATSLSKNMIIYGHTTGRDTGVAKQSFRSLRDYKNKETFIKAPIMKYSTLTGEYTYKICAVFLTTTMERDDGGYVFNYIYPDMSDSNMVGYIEQVRQRMLYETGVSLEPTDKVLALSTCIYDYGKNVDTRLVIVGRLLHEGESESIDSSLVKDNPDYRRPQVWYDSQRIANPYKDSRSWQPSPN